MGLEEQIILDQELAQSAEIYIQLYEAIKTVIDRKVIASVSEVRQQIKKNPVYGKFSCNVCILRVFYDMQTTNEYEVVETNGGKTFKLQQVAS